MTRAINRLKTVLLLIVALGATGSAIYQFGWKIPRDRCLAKSGWWDGRHRVCGRPVLISDITGRVIEDKAAEAAAKAAIGRVDPPAKPAPVKPVASKP